MISNYSEKNLHEYSFFFNKRNRQGRLQLSAYHHTQTQKEMSASAAPTHIRFSSAAPPSAAALRRPRRRCATPVRCSLAAAPGLRAPPELIDSILSKVMLKHHLSALLGCTLSGFLASAQCSVYAILYSTLEHIS